MRARKLIAYITIIAITTRFKNRNIPLSTSVDLSFGFEKNQFIRNKKNKISHRKKAGHHKSATIYLTAKSFFTYPQYSLNIMMRT
tara:strand:- start:2133 stop:2387 length:255 start_codon:yes stop_codon:yes gene_type:complete